MNLPLEIILHHAFPHVAQSERVRSNHLHCAHKHQRPRTYIFWEPPVLVSPVISKRRRPSNPGHSSIRPRSCHQHRTCLSLLFGPPLGVNCPPSTKESSTSGLLPCKAATAKACWRFHVYTVLSVPLLCLRCPAWFLAPLWNLPMIALTVHATKVIKKCVRWKGRQAKCRSSIS